VLSDPQVGHSGLGGCQIGGSPSCRRRRRLFGGVLFTLYLRVARSLQINSTSTSSHIEASTGAINRKLPEFVIAAASVYPVTRRYLFRNPLAALPIRKGFISLSVWTYTHGTRSNLAWASVNSVNRHHFSSNSSFVCEASLW